MIKGTDTLPCFPKLNASLETLLRELTPSEWRAATHFPSWTVKDIVAHLLDTSLRRLSSQRDQFRLPSQNKAANLAELTRRITFVADRWAEALAFVSPPILTELVHQYQDELVQFFQTLDPDANSPVPVSWAGESVSTNRFDIAREYTERWHHQMHIREALGKAPILSRDLYYPVLDTFMNALPYHFRSYDRPDGYVLEVKVEGDSGGRWFLKWEGGARNLCSEIPGEANTKVCIDPSVAWKLFTRFNDSLYEKRIDVDGDQDLGNHLLEMKCVMIE